MKNIYISEIPVNLLREAIEALDIGLEYYNTYLKYKEEKNLKIAILQLQRFIEYIFKYFIAEINPLLVFTDAFNSKINLNNSKSITLNQAINFYINNLKFGLFKNEQVSPDTLNKYIKRFNQSRNEINHWFVDLSELKKEKIELSKLFQIIYLVCLNHNIIDKINNKISTNNQKLLKEFTTQEWRKLQNAYDKVEAYKAERTSPDPKEFNPLDAPIFYCPNCNVETFILASEKVYYCPHCSYSENAGLCSVNLVCVYEEIPESYLSEWNVDQDHQDMICDDCHDEINARIEKD